MFKNNKSVEGEFHLNDETSGFHPQAQKFECFRTA